MKKRDILVQRKWHTQSFISFLTSVESKMPSSSSSPKLSKWAVFHFKTFMGLFSVDVKSKRHLQPLTSKAHKN